MTPDEARALVLERYPRARVDLEDARFCIMSGRGVFMLSCWRMTEAEAWIDAAQRIKAPEVKA